MNRSGCASFRSVVAASLALAVSLAAPSLASAQDFEVRTWSSAVSGDTVTYTLTVCNNGPAVPSVLLKVWLLGTAAAPSCSTPEVPDASIPFAMAANSCETAVVPLAGFPTGAFTSAAMLDANCAFTEANEGNNVKTTSFTVGSLPDVSVSALSFKVGAAGTTVSLTLCHTGPTSTPVRLKLWADRAAPVTCTSSGADISEIITLTTATCDTFAGTVAGFQPPMQQTAQVFIDADCTLTESAETNNVRTTKYPARTHDTDIQPIWSANCADSGCHLSPFPPESLNLNVGAAYADLVGAAAGQLPSMPRVTAFSTATSYLWHKLSGTQTTVGGGGDRMPRFRPPLGAADMATIREWIEEGAYRR